MLPRQHRNAYQNLLAALITLREQAASSHPDPVVLGENCQRVQRIFDQEILTLTSDELAPPIVPRFHSLQTEIHRFLRLLATDLLFLQSSRQVTTCQRRLEELGKRLEAGIAYCQAMVEMDEREAIY